MYQLFFQTLLSRFDAERVHHLALSALSLAALLPGVTSLLRWWFSVRHPGLRTEVLGCHFDGPLGLAAGFDKDARAYRALGALGFGFVEVGTLTGEAQPGNPKPRMFRLKQDRALINRLGFNNGGSRAAVERLQAARALPIGINIGKTKVVPEEEATADYVASAERLGALADYMVVNVSSPNTPGLRNLQAVELLEPLLKEVRGTLDRVSPDRHVPLLVKIAPDLADEDVDAVADMALRLKLDGIIATNTTISREGLATNASEVEAIGAGGLSGAPVRERSLQVLRRLRQRAGSRLVLIGVGGVGSAEDVLQRIKAGASLVQAYTGFVYGGPAWPARVQRELVRLLEQQGFASVTEAVGADVTPQTTR